MTALHHFRDQFFKQIHTSNLVYNTCWEDPRCDRQLLQINEESKLCMITSAGCNALDYLLKPFNQQQLQNTIRNASSISRGLKDLVAVSLGSRQVLQLANRAAQTRLLNRINALPIDVDTAALNIVKPKQQTG